MQGHLQPPLAGSLLRLAHARGNLARLIERHRELRLDRGDGAIAAVEARELIAVFDVAVQGDAGQQLPEDDVDAVPGGPLHVVGGDDIGVGRSGHFDRLFQAGGQARHDRRSL